MYNIPRTIRSFSEMTGLLDKGKVQDFLDEKLISALEKLDEMPNGKGKATITYSVTIYCEGGELSVTPDIKSKLPERKFRPTTFWASNGALSLEHPSQQDMFGVREVARPNLSSVNE